MQVSAAVATVYLHSVQKGSPTLLTVTWRRISRF